MSDSVMCPVIAVTNQKGGTGKTTTAMNLAGALAHIGRRVLPSIKFHTLRACFATQLISTGVPPTVVMKICGWKDMKTMQRYVRLAGVDEAGATEVLRFLSTDEAVMEHVVDLVEFRTSRPKNGL